MTEISTSIIVKSFPTPVVILILAETAVCLQNECFSQFVQLVCEQLANSVLLPSLLWFQTYS